jgi:hypothetical protein
MSIPQTVVLASLCGLFFGIVAGLLTLRMFGHDFWVAPLILPERFKRENPFFCRVVTRDPFPQGDLIIRTHAHHHARELGGAEKNGLVLVLRWDVNEDFAWIVWYGGDRHGPASGYVRKRYLVRLRDPAEARAHA